MELMTYLAPFFPNKKFILFENLTSWWIKSCINMYSLWTFSLCNIKSTSLIQIIKINDTYNLYILSFNISESK